MEFFKPEDFEIRGGPGGSATASLIAGIANRLLQERGKVVRAHQSSLDYGAWYEEEAEPNPTHRALLICVEEIEKVKVDDKYLLIQLERIEMAAEVTLPADKMKQILLLALTGFPYTETGRKNK